ncbi:MAG: Hsp20/alpha crystallin family protein [Parcubacteria group bacterium]|nr:MAG: Hsp20/alpha crystallin family protein [Parcubacteria group bacterium]
MKSKKADMEIKVDEESRDESWLTENFDGQLSVDVYQTEKEIVVKSTIAGVAVEDLDISLHNDMLTIRGKRNKDYEINPDDYFYQECYWGGFSRSIILPIEVKADEIAATLKNGILTVTLPKAQKSSLKIVNIKEEE